MKKISSDGSYFNPALDISGTSAEATERNVDKLRIERPLYQLNDLQSDCNYTVPKRSALSRLSSIKNCRPLDKLKSLLPILSWLPEYSWKRDFFGDLTSGCTIGVMQIPQGLGYALLGNVPPVMGLYMAFFPVLVYFFLGTSRHNSMGTFAVISIMVGKSVLIHANVDGNEHEIRTGNSTSGVLAEAYTSSTSYTPIEVASVLCLLVGAWQMVFFVFRLGVISTLLSETLVSGFTTAAAVHVVTSQIKDLLGLKMQFSSENFQLIQDYIELFRQIMAGKINWIAVSISAIAILALIINNEVLKPRLSKHFAIPVPMELILIIIGTTLSRSYDFEQNLSLKTIGTIPTGFPEAKVPPVSLFHSLLVESFTMAAVSYTIQISMAQIFAQKLNYEISFNQELLAMGAGNIFSSFFSCMPYCASLSRSMVQQLAGGNTQLASVISSVIVVVVLLWIAPFFEPLPRCILASIIVVALKGLLFQMKDFFKFAKLSKIDAVVWLGTFFATVLVSIDLGLLMGLILSILSLLCRGMKPYTCLLGQIPGTDLYLDIRRYHRAIEIPSIQIFHFCGSLNFASRNVFKESLLVKLKLNLPAALKAASKKFESTETLDNRLPFEYLILDFTALSYIDLSGVAFLLNLVKDLNRISLNVYLTGISSPCFELMKKCDFFAEENKKCNLFLTVHDAVCFAQKELEETEQVFYVHL